MRGPVLPANATRLWGAFALALVLLMTGFLVGPRAPADEQDRACVANLVTSSPFGLSLGCDAFHNLHIGRQPQRLLDVGSFRQSRPLLAIPASILRPLFLWAQDAPKWFGIRPAPDINPGLAKFVPSILENDFPTWLAYILVNVLELAAAFAVYLRLVMGSATGKGWSAPSAALVAIGAVGMLIVANDVVKAFVFNAHVQMFNVLAPLFGLLVLAQSAGSAQRAAIVGFGAGVGILAYPLMVIVAVCYGLRTLYELYLDRDVRAFLIRASVVVICTAIPVLGWYGFVMWRVGSFYSDSLAYKQLVWVADSFRTGTLIVDLGYFFGALIYQASLQAIALVAMFALAFWVLRRTTARLSREDRELIGAALVTSIAVLIFHALAGFFMARVAYGILPPLVVICGLLTRVAFERTEARGQWAAAFVFVLGAQMIFTVVKAGPYG